MEFVAADLVAATPEVERLGIRVRDEGRAEEDLNGSGNFFRNLISISWGNMFVICHLMRNVD